MEEERLLRIAISRTVDPMQERGAEEMASEGERGAEGVSASSCGEWVKVICAWECRCLVKVICAVGLWASEDY